MIKLLATKKQVVSGFIIASLVTNRIFLSPEKFCDQASTQSWNVFLCVSLFSSLVYSGLIFICIRRFLLLSCCSLVLSTCHRTYQHLKSWKQLYQTCQRILWGGLRGRGGEGGGLKGGGRGIKREGEGGGLRGREGVKGEGGLRERKGGRKEKIERGGREKEKKMCMFTYACTYLFAFNC